MYPKTLDLVTLIDEKKLKKTAFGKDGTLTSKAEELLEYYNVQLFLLSKEYLPNRFGDKTLREKL